MAHIQSPPRTRQNDVWLGLRTDDKSERFNTLTALFGAFTASVGVAFGW